LRVLQINASYKPAYIYGGPTMSVAKLSEQLVKAGCIIEVFTTTANGAFELPVNLNSKTNVDGVDVTYFKRITKDHTHFSPALLIKLWKEAPNFDLVHIHAWWNLVSLFSTFIALIKKTPVLISPRGTLSFYSFNNKNSSIKKLIHNLLGKHLLKRSYIHATSNAEREALAAIIEPKLIFNIPNFVNITTAVNVPVVEDGPVFKLLFLSRIEEKKGLDILLRALPAINIPYSLTIAGDGDKNYVDHLKNIARDNFSDPGITWIGFQNETKFDILRNHQLLVLPSYDENFGNVVIESLSVGTPVLVSSDVGLADYVIKNSFGWVCETTPESISDAINTIAINQAAQMRHIRNTAPAIIRNDFDEGKLIQKYMDMYRHIITHG